MSMPRYMKNTDMNPVNMNTSNYGQWFGRGAGAAGIGAGVYNLINPGKDVSRESMDLLGKIPDQTSQYYSPYFNAGKEALNTSKSQYDMLSQNPGQRLNQIGQDFHESPGFKFALQQALQSTGNNSAAGGMAGSPEYQQNAMNVATGLGDQDYYNYLGHATDLYKTGLSGENDIAHGGQIAGSSMADQIAQMLAAQSGLKYQSNLNKNQQKSSAWGDIIGGAGMLAAFL